MGARPRQRMGGQGLEPFSRVIRAAACTAPWFSSVAASRAWIGAGEATLRRPHFFSDQWGMRRAARGGDGSRERLADDPHAMEHDARNEAVAEQLRDRLLTLSERTHDDVLERLAH